MDEETRKSLEACELAERRDRHYEEQKKRIRPNWDKWKYCEELYLFQAACLSFDIDPDYFNHERPADIEISMRNLGFSLLEIVEIRKKWNDLICIAICAIKNEPPLLQYVRYKDDDGYVIKNYNFAKWVKSIGRTLPPEFPAGTRTDVHQQDTVTVTALQDIPTAIKAAKSDPVKKTLKAAQAFHDDNGRYPEGRELFGKGKDAHGYGDWETFRKTFVRYFSEAG